MTTDKRLSRLSQRFNTPGPATQERIPPPLTHKGSKPERARRRQSLHFANQSFKDLDDAYRRAEHDVYPQKLNKANFVEALVAFGIEHLDDVTALALKRQTEEEE